MKILCLYNNDCALELFEWIRQQGHDITLWSEELDAEWCKRNAFDLTVSYTYRYILSEEHLSNLDNNVVNLHTSFLPFNRGASPNIWSIADDTPRGVTLHYMDKELDKGFIIAQRFVICNDSETLSSSYNALDKAMKELFREAFHYYKYWQEIKKKAIGCGTYHSVSDTEKIRSCIDSYDDTVSKFKKRLAEKHSEED